MNTCVCKGAVNYAVDLTYRLFDFLNRIPYLLARLQEAGNVLASWWVAERFGELLGFFCKFFKFF